MDEAARLLRRVTDSCPDQRGPRNGYLLLAEAHRGLGQTNEEHAVLSKLALVDADALDAYSRLMGLERERRDWRAVQRNAERFLAVNPLVPDRIATSPTPPKPSAKPETQSEPVRTFCCWSLPILPRSTSAWPAAPPGRRPSRAASCVAVAGGSPAFLDAHRLLLQMVDEHPASPQLPRRFQPDPPAPAAKGQ